MKRKRLSFTPEDKVIILKRHLVDKVPVSNLCDKLGLRPTVFFQ
jgi:hypothetical protein